MRKSTWLSMIVGTVCGSVSLVASAQFDQTQQQAQPQQAQQQQAQQRQMQQRQAAQARSNQVVATVNDEPITHQELQRQVQAQMRVQQGGQAGASQTPPGDQRQIQQQALNALVETRLIEQYALEQGPGTQPQEVEKQLEQVRQQLQKQDATLQQLLQSQGQTEEQFRKQIAASIAWQKLIQQRVTPEKLQKYFQEHQQKFQADNYQQAQRQVQQVYHAKVWDDIVQEMKPKAKINIKSQSASPAPQRRQPAQR